MVRIRKKTSKRGKTHQREKIKHKVSETRKKSKKAAKKNTQWKSKQKKDPGIPNNFPYKDQILAEIAEERRKAAEEKQLRKEKRKLEKNGAAVDEEDGEGFDGIRGLSNGTLTEDKALSSSKGKQKAEKGDEEDDTPILINRDYANLSAVFDKADVVLEVLDARDPLAYHSSNLVGCLEKKKLILALNKIDLSPREAVQSWVTQLRRQHTTFLFRSASAFVPTYESRQGSVSQQNSDAKSNDAFGVEGILSALEAEAKKTAKETLTVAIVGIANSGKSSFFNSLLQKSVSPIYKLSSNISGPSTTERPLETKLERNGVQINFIDTPALSWSAFESSEDLRARDVLVRSRGRIDKAGDPISVVKSLIQRADAQDLMLFYNLPAFTKGDDTAFLSALARANKLVKKAGELDLVQAARIVLRDWSTDNFPRYTVPVPSTKPDGDGDSQMQVDEEDMYVTDSATLEAAPTRKELRKGHGLIKLVPLGAEARKVALDENWDEEESDEEDDVEAEGADGADDDEAEDNESGSEDGDEDVEEDEDEDEDDEEEAPPPNPTKRKRQANPPAVAPRKKVAFDVKAKPAKQLPSTTKPSKPNPKKGRK